jgi:hypothetical protein
MLIIGYVVLACFCLNMRWQFHFMFEFEIISLQFIYILTSSTCKQMSLSCFLYRPFILSWPFIIFFRIVLSNNLKTITANTFRHIKQKVKKKSFEQYFCLNWLQLIDFLWIILSRRKKSEKFIFNYEFIYFFKDESYRKTPLLAPGAYFFKG